MNLRSDEEAAKRSRTEDSQSELPASGSASTSAEDFLNSEEHAEEAQTEQPAP